MLLRKRPPIPRNYDWGIEHSDDEGQYIMDVDSSSSYSDSNSEADATDFDDELEGSDTRPSCNIAGDIEYDYILDDGLSEDDNGSDEVGEKEERKKRKKRQVSNRPRYTAYTGHESDYILNDELGENDDGEPASVRITKRKHLTYSTLTSTEGFSLGIERSFTLPLLSPELGIARAQLKDDLLYIVDRLCTFAAEKPTYVTEPLVSPEQSSFPGSSHSEAWTRSTQHFFQDVTMEGMEAFVDSVLSRMPLEVQMLLGSQTYTANDICSLPACDLTDGSIYCDIIQGLVVDLEYTWPDRVYVGSAVTFSLRFTTYRNTKTGKSNRERSRRHLHAATSPDAAMNLQALMVFEQSEIGTAMFSVCEGLCMILLRTVQDINFRSE
ncbi:hypothetical protein DBV05_g2797 [Lasiodiplodia theobromae]|uniref:Uncharacterized protein n=1 Tax=Lasiodiplodia theobromae TaxID=45133 RepID=A0A5N5DKY5_9PEZI|nr:hypothetical protein DBV05_g2797 [Lasiodiplodia theobromae]